MDIKIRPDLQDTLDAAVQHTGIAELDYVTWIVTNHLEANKKTTDVLKEKVVKDKLEAILASGDKEKLAAVEAAMEADVKPEPGPEEPLEP